MTTSTVLLDTSILINVLHRKPREMTLLQDLTVRGIGLAISCITVAELYAGMRIGEEKTTQALLSALDSIPLDSEIAREAGLIRAAQRRIGKTFALDDMLIATTAIHYGYSLITENRKDFAIPGIYLYPYA